MWRSGLWTKLGYYTNKRTDVWSRDFIIWKINSGLWAVVWAGLWNKRVWTNYEQLLRLIFYGQNINLKLFWKYFNVPTEKLHRIKVNKSQTNLESILLWGENQFFLGLKIWVKIHEGWDQTSVFLSVGLIGL